MARKQNHHKRRLEIEYLEERQLLSASPSSLAVLPTDSPSMTVSSAAPAAPAAAVDLAYHPFSADSPWNRPLPADASFTAVDSPGFTVIDGKVTNGGALNSTHWSHPIYIATTSDPVRSIFRIGNPNAIITMPVPASAAPDPELDAHLHIIDPNHQFVIEMWEARIRPDGNIEATDVYQNDLAGPGVYADHHGARAYGGSAIAGLIRKGELLQGIPHALAIAMPSGVMNKVIPGAPVDQHWVWPASSADTDKLPDYADRGNVYMGSLLAIPKSVQLTDIGVGSPGDPAYELAKALQTYGAYVTDLAGEAGSGMVFYAEPTAAPELPSDVNALLAKIVPYLQIVTNNLPSSAAADSASQPAVSSSSVSQPVATNGAASQPAAGTTLATDALFASLLASQPAAGQGGTARGFLPAPATPNNAGSTTAADLVLPALSSASPSGMTPTVSEQALSSWLTQGMDNLGLESGLPLPVP